MEGNRMEWKGNVFERGYKICEVEGIRVRRLNSRISASLAPPHSTAGLEGKEGNRMELKGWNMFNRG